MKPMKFSNGLSHAFCQPSVFPSLAACVKMKKTFHNVTENMAEQMCHLNSIRVLKLEKTSS